MCVQVCEHVYIHAYMCVCVWGPEDNLRRQTQRRSPRLSTQPLTGLELIHSAPGISLPLLLQHTDCKPQPVFSWMFWGLNWGPHTCKLSTLPDELSGQLESFQANPTFQLKKGTALRISRSWSRQRQWPNKSPFSFLFIASNKSSKVWHLYKKPEEHKCPLKI